MSVALCLLLLIIWWGFNFRYSTRIKPGYTSNTTTSHYSVVWSGIFSFYYSVKTNSSSLVVLDLGSSFNFAASRKLNTATVADRISVLLLRRNLISIFVLHLWFSGFLSSMFYTLCQLFVDYVLVECNYMVC